MSERNSCCYRIESDASKGEYLVATRKISPMDEYIINNEKPIVWNRSTSSGLHTFCDECGLTIGPKVLECLRSHLFGGCDHPLEEADSIMYGLKASIFANEGDQSNPRISCNEISCKNNCGASYCSEICRAQSEATGHYFLCKDAEHELSRIRSFDKRGHLGMALEIYAIIAQRTAMELQSNTNHTVNHIPSIAYSIAQDLLRNVHRVDYIRTVHAHRTGQLSIDDNLFSSLIFPAYFSSHLANALESFKFIFLHSNISLWNPLSNPNPKPNSILNDNNITVNEYATAFVSSDIFSDMYFSFIMGGLTVNALSVYVASPLDDLFNTLLEKFRRPDQDLSTKDSTGRLLQHLWRFNRHTNYDNSEKNDQEEEMTIEQIGSGLGSIVQFPGLHCTALFSQFIKMNHSCQPNTYCISDGHKVTVSVSADRVIECGEEITNSYINHSQQSRATQNRDQQHQVDDLRLLNRQLTKKQRHRALRHYLFLCECPLCQSEQIDSDEESEDEG